LWKKYPSNPYLPVLKNGVSSLKIYGTTKPKKKGFRCYLAGLLGESKRKNIAQITDNIVGSSYYNVHHFIGQSSWSIDDVNEGSLEIINKRNQTRIRNGFTLIVDDSGHVKSGNFLDGVGRQYIGEIGKTENGWTLGSLHLPIYPPQNQ